MLKPTLQHFYLIFPLIKDKLSWETSLLVRSEILGVFRNTLTVDHMYSPHRREEFLEQVHTLLSQPSKKFSGNVIAIFQSTGNFAHFEKKYQLHRLNILEYVDPEKCGYFSA